MLLVNYTDETFVHNPSVLAVLPRDKWISPKFILGVLNSRLMSIIFLQVAPKAKKGLFSKVIITDAKRLPFPILDEGGPQNKTQHDKIVKEVEKMLLFQEKTKEANTPQDKTALQRQIDATDQQIDKLVYELYGLTEEEINIVENACK